MSTGDCFWTQKTYSKSSAFQAAGHTFSLWISDHPDESWDLFLRDTHLGHFEQTSMWGEVKKRSGWGYLRGIVELTGALVGGFQIIYKKSIFGFAYGYISKGPVVSKESDWSYHVVLSGAQQILKSHGIRMAIVQLPDHGRVSEAVLDGLPSYSNHLKSVISANLEISLSQELEEIESRMARSMRKKVRQSTRRDIAIAEGSKEDLKTFFGLMTHSCNRQNTLPNPDSAMLLEVMWDQFLRISPLRLTFAVHDGEAVAGLLCVPFGKRCTQWKKGWSSKMDRVRPNEALAYENILWAKKNGFAVCDFAALDRRLAEKMIQGAPFEAADRKRRDMFNLGFGGDPVLLPKSRVLFRRQFEGKLYRAGSIILSAGSKTR